MMLMIACYQEGGLHELLNQLKDLVALLIEGRQVETLSPIPLLGLSSVCIRRCCGDGSLPTAV